MKIDIIGTNIAAPAIPVPQVSAGVVGNTNGVLRRLVYPIILIFFCFNSALPDVSDQSVVVFFS